MALDLLSTDRASNACMIELSNLACETITRKIIVTGFDDTGVVAFFTSRHDQIHNKEQDYTLYYLLKKFHRHPSAPAK